MREQLEARLAELRQEYESGKKILANLNLQAQELSANLLRLGGAIQVLEEEIAKFDHSVS